jgi:membrane protein DedA with SNARE-associated domain
MTVPEWIQQVIATYGYWAVLVVVGLESMGIPLPGETILVAASVYAGTVGGINPALVIAAAALGAILGDNLGFLIGHYGGSPLLQRLERVFHLDPRVLQYAQRYFAKHGNKTVFLGRFISPLRATIALLAGSNHMPWGTFLLWNLLGGIIWATIFGLLGYELGNNLPLLARLLQVSLIGGIVLVAVLVAAVVVFIRRQRRLQTRL